MADVIVRGMEMPRVCIENGWYGNCPLDRTWCAQRFAPEGSTTIDVHKEQWNNLPSWCPLLPLPEGHGRLGDLDELETTVIDAIEQGFNAEDVLLDIRFATTIIEAEGGGEDGK